MAKSSVDSETSPNSSPQLNSTFGSTAAHNQSDFDSSDDIISLTSAVSNQEKVDENIQEEFVFLRKHNLGDVSNLLHLSIYLAFFSIIFVVVYQFYQRCDIIGRSAAHFVILGYVSYLIYITLIIHKRMSKIRSRKLSKEQQIAYAPFLRLDIDRFTISNFLKGTVLMLSWKTPILLTILFTQIFFTASLQALAKALGENNRLVKHLLYILEKEIRLTARLCLFLFGISSITEYKHKSLDLLPSNGPPRTIISNHTSPLDIMMYFYLIFPSFVSKKNVKDLPLIGFMAEIVNCIFVERKDEQERIKALQDLKERQTNIYKGNANSSLVVFPEGTTTNGLYLLPFKKGVFNGLLPTYGSLIIYESSLFSLAMDVIPMSTWLFVTILNFGTNHVKIYWLPEMKPDLTNESEDQLIKNFCDKARKEMSLIYHSKSTLYKKPTYNLEKLTGTYRTKLDAMEYMSCKP